MPGQHDKTKHQTVIKLPHETWRRIEVAASQHAMNPTEYLRWVITEHVATVELTKEDYDLIHERISEAFKKGRPV